MSLGNGLHFAALPLLAASITRAPLAVASVTFAEVLPWLFVSLPSGAIADRYDRRRLMQLSAVGRVVLLALLLALMPLHLLSIPVLVGLGLLLGSTDTFGGNAAVGLVRGLVRPAQLEQANSVVGGIDAVLATLVGPTLGAVLFSVATGAPFGLDALGFLLAALLLQGVRGDFRPRREAPATLLQEMRSGISWLWHHQMLRTLTVLFATNNLAFGMIFGILVLYVLEVLRLPQAAYGALLATLAVGALVGAGLGARLGPRLRRQEVVVVALGTETLCLAAAGVWPVVPVVAAAFVLIGLADSVWSIVVISYRQRQVPDPILGRVTSAFRTLGVGAQPVGTILGGVLSQWIGLRAPFLAGAAVLLASTLLAAWAIDGAAFRAE